MSFFLTAAIVGLVPMAGTAIAAPATAVTDLNPDTGLPAGQTASLSFAITPDSRTLSRFTLTPPSGYKVETIGAVSAGVAQPSGGGILVTGLSASPSQTVTLSFTAKASCVSGGPHLWGVDARDTQNRQYSPTGDRATDVSGNCVLAFVNQPGNTKAGELITNGDRQTGGPIEVRLTDGLGNLVTHIPVPVTFAFGSNPNGAAAILTVGTETTVDGVATFDDETPGAEGGDGLEINIANVAAFTEYTLVPKGATAATESITGPASVGFDIWEDATKCVGANCALSHDGDEYLVPNGQAGALLSASTFTPSESNINCDGYTEITSEVVWHEYTGTGAVLVKIHITKAEMKAVANNGQARVEVCVGLLDEGTLSGEEKWANLGVVADHQDSNGDTIDDIWVGLAPACPNQTPDLFAPCIARQYGDGGGGSYTEVWIPGGDPPRRT